MEWIRLGISLVGVIGLILLFYWLLHKYSRRTTVVGGNKLKIIDRANLGRDSMLLVVSVCHKLMLIGVTSGKIEKISDLEVSEEEYFGLSETEALQNASQSTPSFSEVLTGITKNFKNGKNSESENSDNLENEDEKKE